MYRPRDNKTLHMDEDSNPHIKTRTIALRLVDNRFEAYHHRGCTPYRAEAEAARKAMANEASPKQPHCNKRETDKPGLVASPAATAATSHVRRWVVDSGSGYDFDYAPNVEHFRNLIRKAVKPIALWTPNRLMPAEK